VEIDLRPLDDASARTLVRSRFPAATVPAVEAIVAAAHGLPLALNEIPVDLTEAQLRAEDPLPEPLPVGATLGELYAGRLADLDDDALLALLVASLEPLRRDQLVSVLARLDLDLDVLHIPERTGLVRLGPEGAEFPHAATAGAVQAGATDRMRRRAHQALADLFSDEPSRRARHLAVVVTGPDEQVARAWSAAAADAERRGAWLVAGHAHEAAARRRPGGADRIALRAAAAAFAHAGAATPLVRLLKELTATASRPAERLTVETELLAARVWSGDPALDVRTARSLADRLGPVAPTEAARLRTVIALALVISGRATDARSDLVAARRLVPEPTDAGLAVSYDLLEAYLAGAGGSARLAEWIDTLTDAELVGPSLELVAATSTLLWSDEPELADALLARQCEALRAVGALGLIGVSEGLRAAITQRRGDWTGAAARFLGAIDLCADTDLLGPLPHIRLRYAYLLAAQGRESRCRAVVDEVRRADPGSPLLDHLGTCILGLLELTLGRAAEARDLLVLAGAIERDADINQPGYSSRAVDLVDAHWRTGDLDAARREADALAVQAELWGRGGPLAAAARCRAMLGPDDRVDPEFAAAVAFHRTAVDVFEEARTELAWGRRLRRMQRKRDARPHLRAALETFERLDAEPWAAQARSELAACGERRTAGRSFTAELTPRELEVAVAVARGASNRQAAAELCISRRTVEDHLGRVYRKLGVADRHDLAAALGQVDAD
jgi:DNA-binding CsgD family transcriptional regulator